MTSEPTSFDAPTARRIDHIPLLVAVENEDGAFVSEPRLRVQQLQLSCDGELSRASLSIYTGAIFETDYHAADPEIPAAEVISGQPRISGHGMLSPDQLVIVYQPLENDQRRILFSGYGEIPQYAERGSVRGSEAGGQIIVESVLKRVAKSLRGIIDCRYVRKASSQDAWRTAYVADAGAKQTPIGDDTDCEGIAMPCTFNARGEANRSPAPITVSINGQDELIHVFTDDDDPDAEPWTWCQALRYLAFFHALKLTGGVLSGEIDATNVFDQTRTYATLTPTSRPAVPVSESSDYTGAPDEVSQLLKFGLLDYPRDAVFAAMNIHEALTVVANQTGCRFRVQTENNDLAPGQPTNSLIFWARGGGPRRTVGKSWSASGRTDRTISEITHDLNLEQYTIAADYNDVCSAVLGYGDLRRYEITAELVPGWLPSSDLDVPTDVEAAVDSALEHGSNYDDEDTWCQKYHKSGSSFPQYANVGRRWVLNETGRYPAATYARDSGHFVAAAYAPWEPSDCLITDTQLDENLAIETVDVAEGSWSRRPRPFRECFSADASNRSLGVVVHASWDSGTNWRAISAKVLSTEAGIYLEQDDLSTMLEPIEGGKSFWEAMCRGTARVRVTGVIDGDWYLDASLGQVAGLPITHESAKLFNWPDKLKSNRRDGGNSIFYPFDPAKADPAGSMPVSYAVVECRDDLATLLQWVNSLMDVLTLRQMPASFVIPWLEFDRYWVGDCITEIVGQALPLEGAPSGGKRRPPDVVSIVYSGTSTQLVLEDPAMRDLAGLGIGG